MNKVTGAVAAVGFGFALGWAAHRPPPAAPAPATHIRLAVPVNWHPEPVRLAVRRVESPAGTEEYPVDTGTTGPAWVVTVGRTTYSCVRE